MARVGRPRKAGPRTKSGALVKQRKAPADTRTCVYVIAVAGSSICKVGVSANPGKRAADLQVSQPGHVNVYWAGRCDEHTQAFAIENLTHRRMKAGDLHQRGEWFSCSFSFARSEILEAAKTLGLNIEEDGQFGWHKRWYGDWPVVNGRKGRLPEMKGVSWPVA